MKRTRVQLISVAVGVLLALGIGGCLVADKTVTVSYDPATDVFRFLTVFQQIHSDKPENQESDAKWLAALYANRDHLIVEPGGSPFWMEDVGEQSVLRLSNTSYAMLDLGQISKDGIRSVASDVDLSDVTIQPGKFFLGGKNNLCYYHQILVPGKIADYWLDRQNRQWKLQDTNSISTSIDQEISRRNQGGASMTWDQFWTQLADLTAAALAGEKYDPPAPWTAPLETQSLKTIKADLLSGKLRLVRDKGDVLINAELTAADVQGFCSAVDAYRKEIVERSQVAVPDSTTEPSEHLVDRQRLLNLLNSVTVTSTDATHVQVRVDIVKAFGGFYGPLDPTPAMDDKGAIQSSQMVDVAGKQLNLDQQLTMEQVVDQFNAGKLAANASDKPVTPGDGLGKILPATQPAGQ